MKKQVSIAISVVFIAFSAFAEDTKEKNEIYWQVTPNTVAFNEVDRNMDGGNTCATIPCPWPSTEKTKSETNKSSTSQMKIGVPEIPFDKKLERGLAELLLRFDSMTDSFLKEAKHLDVDTIELRVVMNAEGKFAIVSGNVQGSVAIILKKRSN